MSRRSKGPEGPEGLEPHPKQVVQVVLQDARSHNSGWLGVELMGALDLGNDRDAFAKIGRDTEKLSEGVSLGFCGGGG